MSSIMDLVSRDVVESKKVYQELLCQVLQLLLDSSTSRSKSKHLSLSAHISLLCEYRDEYHQSASSLALASDLIRRLLGVVELISPPPLSFESLCPPTVMSFLSFFNAHYRDFSVSHFSPKQESALLSFLSSQSEPELWTSTDYPQSSPVVPSSTSGVHCYWTFASRLIRFGAVQQAKHLLKCHSGYRDLVSAPSHSLSDQQLIEDWSNLFEVLDTVEDLYPGCLPERDDDDDDGGGGASSSSAGAKAVQSTSFLRVHTNWKKEVKRQLSDPNVKLFRTLPQLKTYVLKALAFEPEEQTKIRDLHWSETLVPTLLYTNPFSTLDDIHFLISKLAASAGSKATQKFDALIISLLSPPNSRGYCRPHEVLSRHLVLHFQAVGSIPSRDVFWSTALCHACAAIAFEYQWRVSCYAAASAPLNEEAPPFPDERSRLEVLLGAAEHLAALDPDTSAARGGSGAATRGEGPTDGELAVKNALNLAKLCLTRAVASPPRGLSSSDGDLLVVTDRPPSRLAVEAVVQHLQAFVESDCGGIVVPGDEAADSAAAILVEEVDGPSGAVFKRLHMGGKPARAPKWASGVDFTTLLVGRHKVHMDKGNAAAACKWLAHFPYGSASGNFRMIKFLEDLNTGMIDAMVSVISPVGGADPEHISRFIYYCGEVLRHYPPTPDQSPPPGALRLMQGLFASAQALVSHDDAAVGAGLAAVLAAARSYAGTTTTPAEPKGVGAGNNNNNNNNNNSCATFPARMSAKLLVYVEVVLAKLRDRAGDAAALPRGAGEGDSKVWVGLDREAMDTVLELAVRYQGAAASGTVPPRERNAKERLDAIIGQESIWTAVVENRRRAKRVEGGGGKKSAKKNDKTVDALLDYPNPDCF